MAIEGLDGCGKSTLASALAARLGARHAVTPPRSVAGLRQLFSTAPPAVARAFYMCGNYIAADEQDDHPTVVRSFSDSPIYVPVDS